jgi:hypothetical protein
MSQYKAGTYVGHATDYGISETKGGSPQVFVTFEMDMAGTPTTMTWQGSLNGGAVPHTLKALVVLGFLGKDVTDLLDGPDSGMLPLNKDVKLVVENQPYTKDGETTPTDFYKIAWVNSMQGGGGGVQRADASTAKAKLLKLGLAGTLAKVRLENPQPVDDTPF